jgi:cytochrome c556
LRSLHGVRDVGLIGHSRRNLRKLRWARQPWCAASLQNLDEVVQRAATIAEMGRGSEEGARIVVGPLRYDRDYVSERAARIEEAARRVR